MQIRAVDVHDETEFRSFHQVQEASLRFGRPLATVASEHEAAVLFRQDDGYMRVEAFGAFDQGRMVGAGQAFFPVLDNTEKVYFNVHVAPDMRRRGYGTALVGYLVDRAQEIGRTVLIGDSHLPAEAGEDHPHHLFATKSGFTLANAELHRVLELPVADERIQGWIDEAAPLHDGYHLATYVNDLPDPLLPSYVHLLNQLAVDAPTGELGLEEERLTVEAFRRRQARVAEQGRTMFITVATVGDERAAEAVAHSVIGVPPPGADEPHMYQWATLVRRDHRGHHLGMAVKARNLREVQKAHPERTMVHTSNSQANGPMVAINERIGFRPVEVNAEYLRRIS